MFASRPTFARMSALGALLLILAVTACGKGGKEDTVVAQVGDRDITLKYFEHKMNTIPADQLPANIESQEGREELLETMINKEVMSLKSEALGLDSSGEMDAQAHRIANLKAVTKMRQDVASVSKEVTEEEILDYYEMLPRKLMASYMLFDFEDQAREAKALVEGGEVWRNVAEKFLAGDPGRSGDYTMPILYGTLADDFEREVFSLPIGGISDPIETPYGFFVIRVDDVTLERVQPLDTIREQVIASVKKQKEQLALTDFINQVFDEYNLVINDDAVKIVYDAIPEDLPLTPPYPDQSELKPLDIPLTDLDTTLMSYADDVWSLRRYKDFFDASSIFGRPRREGRAGGLRRALKEIVIRELMDRVAIDRGYGDDPEVDDEYRLRHEQMMVSQLNKEFISDEVDLSPQDLQAFWEEHSTDYDTPELRDVEALIAETEADALSAQIDLAGGATWEKIVDAYCVKSDIRENKGVVGLMRADSKSPLTAIAFSLAKAGDLSEPTELEDGRWALVRVKDIRPPEHPELADVRARVAARLKGVREDELFAQRIEEWKQEYTIKRYPKRLMKAVYDPQEPEPNSVTVGFGG